MANYDTIDFDWTWDGDIISADDGDIQDTSYDRLKSLETEIATQAASVYLDWEKDPEIGLGLDDFVGEANTRENARRMEQRARMRLIDSGIVKGSDLTVRVVPLSIERVLLAISVLTVATENNRLTVSDPISVNIVFDTTERGVFVMPISNLKDLKELI